MRTLYRLVDRGAFSKEEFPWQEKRKTNGYTKKVGKKLFAVAWKNGKKRILILKKSLDIGKVIGLWAKSFKRNCDLS